MALELAKGICQVEDGGGWWRNYFASNRYHRYLWRVVFLSRSDPMPQDSKKDRPGTSRDQNYPKSVNTEDATRQDEAAPSPATLWSEKPAMPLLPGAWLQ